MVNLANGANPGDAMPVGQPIPAAADLSGTLPGPRVVRLQARDVGDINPNDQDRLTWVQANNRCDPLSGTCVEVEVGVDNWQALETVQAVTPTMITVKWPDTGFPCNGPMNMRVRRPNPPGSDPDFAESPLISPVVCLNDEPVPE